MTLFFYLFSALMILGSLGVVNTKNSVHAVLYLIFTFCNSAGLMLLLGAEFIALTLVIVYVGAVAVLFLFVVMMLDIKISHLSPHPKNAIGLSYFLGLLVFLDIACIFWIGSNESKVFSFLEFAVPSDLSNTQAIGRILYTDFFVPFQMIGMILLVAIIACIMLSVEARTKSKKQKPSAQIARTKDSSFDLISCKSDSGVDGLKYE